MTTDTVGGVWVYSLELARALGEKGVEVALATAGAPLSQVQRSEASEIDNLRIFEGNYKLEWMDNPWEDIERAGNWLLELEGKLRPDIVHLNNYAHGALPWRAPVVIVGHSCVLSWWEAVHGGEKLPPKWHRYEKEIKKGLSSAKAVLAPSIHMLTSLERHYGPIRNGKVIPNGRSPEHFFPAFKKHFIFSAGRLWDEAKNIAALDKAAAGIGWPIYVAGQNTDPDGKKVNLRNVRMFGHISAFSLAGWLSHASIYALPARYEPFGLSALEAALAGCALVLGDIPSLREIWGKTAVYVPPDDIEALQTSINSLISDARLRKKMAAFARKRAHEFTAKKMSDAYMTVYMELLEGRSAEAPRFAFNEMAAADTVFGNPV